MLKLCTVLCGKKNEQVMTQKLAFLPRACLLKHLVVLFEENCYKNKAIILILPLKTNNPDGPDASRQRGEKEGKGGGGEPVAQLLIGCLFFLLTPRSTSGPDRLGETSLAVTGRAT